MNVLVIKGLTLPEVSAAFSICATSAALTSGSVRPFITNTFTVTYSSPAFTLPMHSVSCQPALIRTHHLG